MAVLLAACSDNRGPMDITVDLDERSALIAEYRRFRDKKEDAMHCYRIAKDNEFELPRESRSMILSALFGVYEKYSDKADEQEVKIRELTGWNKGEFLVAVE